MPSDRRQLRGVVLAEDKRTERFFRELLRVLRFDERNFRFETAPTGRGSAEAWVAKRYPGEVRVLRSKNFQKSLRLIAVRDGDRDGVSKRKRQLDKALEDAKLAARQTGEGIANPVPTWHIETWLLDLLNNVDLDETTDYKHDFEHEHGADERTALRQATAAWNDINETSLPSLRDGELEMKRIDP